MKWRLKLATCSACFFCTECTVERKLVYSEKKQTGILLQNSSHFCLYGEVVELHVHVHAGTKNFVIR